MARKTAGPNPDRERFIAECMREYAKYFVVRGYPAPEPDAVALRAKHAGDYYDAVVAPYAAGDDIIQHDAARPAPKATAKEVPAEIGKK